MVALAVELAATVLDPSGASAAQALGTVAVAAGAVAEPTVFANVPLFHEAAEGGGAAAFDGGHGAPLPDA